MDACRSEELANGWQRPNQSVILFCFLFSFFKKRYNHFLKILTDISKLLYFRYSWWYTVTVLLTRLVKKHQTICHILCTCRFVCACSHVFVWYRRKTVHLLMPSNSITVVVWECNISFIKMQHFIYKRSQHIFLRPCRFLYCPVWVTSLHCHIAVPLNLVMNQCSK